MIKLWPKVGNEKKIYLPVKSLIIYLERVLYEQRKSKNAAGHNNIYNIAQYIYIITSLHRNRNNNIQQICRKNHQCRDRSDCQDSNYDRLHQRISYASRLPCDFIWKRVWNNRYYTGSGNINFVFPFSDHFYYFLHTDQKEKTTGWCLDEVDHFPYFYLYISFIYPGWWNYCVNDYSGNTGRHSADKTLCSQITSYLALFLFRMKWIY